MPASEKQTNYIKSLYNEIQKHASDLNDDLAKAVAEKIAPHREVLVQVMAEEDIESWDAKTLIPVLIDVVNQVKPAAANISWKKYEGKWAIAGSPDVIVPGATVEVRSSKGTQEVVVGELVYVRETIVMALPKQEEGPVATVAGFYRKGDDIIEAYYTKNKILVARKVNKDGSKGDYLGKAGLRNLTDMMSLEDAKEFGRETGVCISCGALLTDPVSIEAGIGPTCATKWGI